MRVSEKQDFVIDTLLATHRELTAVDLVDYKIYGLCKGGIVLTIKSGEYFYSYKILSSGAITEKTKSENGVRFTPFSYFQ